MKPWLRHRRLITEDHDLVRIRSNQVGAVVATTETVFSPGTRNRRFRSVVSSGPFLVQVLGFEPRCPQPRGSRHPARFRSPATPPGRRPRCAPRRPRESSTHRPPRCFPPGNTDPRCAAADRWPRPCPGPGARRQPSPCRRGRRPAPPDQVGPIQRVVDLIDRQGLETANQVQVPARSFRRAEEPFRVSTIHESSPKAMNSARASHPKYRKSAASPSGWSPPCGRRA